MQMKRSIHHIYILIIVAATAAVVAAACATSSGSLPTAEQLLHPVQAGADENTEALNRGRALLVTQCATCHRLYWPREYSPEEWEGIIRKMGRSASLSKGQIEEIQAYMRLASLSERQKTDAPE